MIKKNIFIWLIVLYFRLQPSVIDFIVGEYLLAVYLENNKKTEWNQSPNKIDIESPCCV